jgi:prophage antirepressor-like protein
MAEKPELELIPEGELQICQFAGKEIRKVCHNDEWFFSIVDVIEALADTNRPAAYWNDLKTKLAQNEGFKGLYDKIEKLPLAGKDGVKRPSEMGNTETVFRVIQSIPSQKAEPFKQWLAKVGYERIQEHQNPSIAIKRAICDYQLQGRNMEWIEARLRTLVSRKELTDEWHARGVNDNWEYGALTDTISKESFGKSTKDHKAYKGLGKNHSLRDNMTEMELILTMLGETSTKQIARHKDAKGFEQNKSAAKSGGRIAGNARKELEEQTGQSVLSKENKLGKLPPSKDLLQLPENYDESMQVFKTVKKTR